MMFYTIFLLLTISMMYRLPELYDIEKKYCDRLELVMIIVLEFKK